MFDELTTWCRTNKKAKGKDDKVPATNFVKVYKNWFLCYLSCWCQLYNMKSYTKFCNDMKKHNSMFLYLKLNHLLLVS